MAGDFGINNNTNLFNSMLGSTSTGSSTGGSSVLGDYAMIRSGAYKKLLNAYYNEDKKTGSTSVEEATEEKAEKNALLTIKTAAAKLGEAATALGKTDGTGEKRLEAAKSFVEAYNSLLDSTQDVDNTKVLQKTIWMINDVKASDGLLEDAGITIGKDNKLTLNEETFKKAGTSVLSTLFDGRTSLMGKINSKAFDIMNRSTQAITKMNGGTTYTDKGNYTKVNTSTLYDNLL